VTGTVPAAPGILANIVFIAGDVADTCNAKIGLSNWYFAKDDMNPVLSDGAVRILPETPRMKWVSLTAPTEIRWDRTIHDYVPNPITIHAVMRNAGDTAARNTRFYVFANSKYLIPLEPDGTEGNPLDADGYGGRTEADLKVTVNKQSAAVDSTFIWVTATFDNHPDMSSSVPINIPRSEPVLDCSISLPEVTIGQSGHQYSPMPVQLRLTVRNTGVITAYKVHADISLPAGMHLAGSTADSGTGKFFAFISAGASTSAVWTLQRDPSSVPASDTVHAVVWIDNIDTASTYAALAVPGMDAPSIAAQCSAPTELTYDEASDLYLPNPVTVSLQCSNTGTMQARDLSARLILPPDMQLADPSDSLRRVFDPAQLDAGASTQPVSWPILYNGGHATEVTRKFICVVTWTADAGGFIDSTLAICNVTIPQGKPSLVTSMELPDTSRVDAKGTNLEPNPFYLKAIVKNTSQRNTRISKIRAATSGTPATAIFSGQSEKSIDRNVAPGDSVEGSWEVYLYRTLYTRTVPFDVLVLDDSDRIISRAQAGTVVEGLSNPFVCGRSNEVNYCRLSSYYDRYDTNVYVNSTFSNISPSPLTNVEVTAELNDPLGLLVIDSTYSQADAGNGWTRRASKLDSGTVWYSWHFHLVKPNPLDRPDTIALSFKYKSDQSPLVESDCRQWIIVDPVAIRDNHAALLFPDTVRSAAGYTGLVPDSFQIVYKTWNSGTAPITISNVLLKWSDNTLQCATGKGSFYSGYSRELNMELQPGDTATATWDMSIINVFTRDIPFSVAATLKDVQQLYVVLDTVHVAGLLKPSIATLDGTIACYWDSLTLDAGAGYSAYDWNTGEKTRVIEAHHEGNYIVNVTAPDMSTASASVWLHFYPMILTPGISRSKNTLSVPGLYSSYQWEYAGWPITGATSSSLGITKTGVYGITVIDSNGCVANATPVVIDMLVGLDQPPATPDGVIMHADIWPEPNRGEVWISMECTRPVDVSIRITDLLGRTITAAAGNGTSSRFDGHMSLGAAPPGVYFVEITAGGQRLARKIVRYK
jgi:hypothetical protein